MNKKFDGVETLQPLLGKCSVARSVQLLKGAATALDIIHSSGKAHLDLNASTVLVSPGDKISLTDPTDERAKPGSVIDLWNQIDATDKTAAAFAPEEIASRSPSPHDRFRGNDMDCLAREQKRDLWAFGVLAYWLLYGKQPFVENVIPEDREAFFSAIASNELRFPPLSAMGEAVPLLLRSKIHRCLQKDARLRSNAIGSGKPEVGAETKQSVSSSASLKADPPVSTTQLIKPRPPGPAVVMLDIEPDHSNSSSSNKTTPTPKHSVLSFSTVFSSGSRKSTQTSQESDPRRTSSSTNFISGLGEMQISQQASSDYCTSSVAGATNSSSNRLLSDLGEKQVSEWEPSSDEGRRSPRMSPTPGLFEVLLRQHQPGSAATIQISSVATDSRTQSQVARPGALEPQQSEDIVVGPAGFELKCTSCTGDIGPLAFRCETDPRYVICANCRADERYDPRLKLIQYAVEKMDEERITGAFGSEVFQQQSRESTSSSRCASSRIGGGVSPRARTLDNIFGAKAESVLFTEGNDGTPQQVSITGLCSFTTIVESFDLESSCASTAQSVSSRRGPPVVESSLSSAPNISMSPPPNSRREDKPFSPRRGGHMGGGGGLHRSPMWRPVALLPDHPGLADDESRRSPFKPVTPQPGGLNPTSQVLVKVEALSQHESTLFGVTGKLPQTQLAATKKNFLQHMGARGGQSETGLEPGRTTTYHEDLVTRVATAKSELDSDSESDASSDPGCFNQTTKPGELPNPRALGFSPPEEDPEEIVDEFLSKADAYHGALAAVEMTVGSGPSVIPLQLNLYTLNLELLPQRLESCGKLDTLSVLDLSENRLEVLPDFVGSCAVNLKKLCLGNNKLKFLPETLGGLSKLEVLEVNHNQLSDLPVSLGQVSTLKTIGLDYNNFSSIPECVWCMPQLTTLFLAANPDILEWPAIENLSFVENLTLGIDNHPKLVRSYKEQRMEVELGDSFEVAWNKVYPEEVLPGKLFLGSLKSAQLEHVYQRLEIGAVLTVARDLKPAIGKNMRHKTIVVDDLPGASFQDSFHDCFDFIDSCPQENNPERGPAVLVHCFAGMSRSSTCVIAYLMTKHKMRLDEAYTMTKEARACIYPNDGFFGQLLQLDAKLYPDSEGYRRLELEGLGRGVIPGFEPTK